MIAWLETHQWVLWAWIGAPIVVGAVWLLLPVRTIHDEAHEQEARELARRAGPGAYGGWD